MNSPSQSHSWPRPLAPLPTEKDFDPWDGDLDAQYAWKNFGGMTLDQAYVEFCDRPEIYTEDFAFMGPKAFSYYFPVIDRYLREISSQEEDDHYDVGYIGIAIQERLEDKQVWRSTKVLSEIRSLTEFVLGNVTRYSVSEKVHRKITRIWMELKQLSTTDRFC